MSYDNIISLVDKNNWKGDGLYFSVFCKESRCKIISFCDILWVCSVHFNVKSSRQTYRTSKKSENEKNKPES